MTPEECKACKEQIAEDNPDALFFDDLDEALVGCACRCGQPTLAVYDYAKIIFIRVQQGMSYEEAVEFTSFNTENAWMGEHTPLILCSMEKVVSPGTS